MIAQFHRKHPGAARHINAALFDSISFSRADLVTSWRSSCIVTPHLRRGGNVRGHLPVSLPSLSTPPLSYTPLSSPTLTPAHMYTPPLSVPLLGAKFSMPMTPGPQRHQLIDLSTTTVVDFLPFPSALTSEASDELWTHWDRSTRYYSTLHHHVDTHIWEAWY
jgi:hypothetical protein